MFSESKIVQKNSKIDFIAVIIPDVFIIGYWIVLETDWTCCGNGKGGDRSPEFIIIEFFFDDVDDDDIEVLFVIADAFPCWFTDARLPFWNFHSFFFTFNFKFQQLFTDF